MADPQSLSSQVLNASLSNIFGGNGEAAVYDLANKSVLAELYKAGTYESKHVEGFGDRPPCKICASGAECRGAKSAQRLDDVMLKPLGK